MDEFFRSIHIGIFFICVVGLIIMVSLDPLVALEGICIVFGGFLVIGGVTHLVRKLAGRI